MVNSLENFTQKVKKKIDISKKIVYTICNFYIIVKDVFIVENFFKSLVEDQNLQEEILEAETEEEMYDIAQPYISEDITFEDFCNALYWEYDQQEGVSLLNENELVNITGGVNNNVAKLKIGALNAAKALGLDR